MLCCTPSYGLYIAEVLADINIEYLYAFVAKCADLAMVLFKVSDTERAKAVLREAGFKVPKAGAVYSM